MLLKNLRQVPFTVIKVICSIECVFDTMDCKCIMSAQACAGFKKSKWLNNDNDILTDYVVY
jgi:hypothetical protein